MLVTTIAEADRLTVVLDDVHRLATASPLRDWTLGTLGVEGERWLDRLPQAVSDAYLVWGFIPEAIHPASVRSLVIIGHAGDQHDRARAVLKVEPNASANIPAIEALHAAGVGPAVLGALRASDAYLLAWLDGTPMPTDDPADAIARVVRTVRTLAATPAPQVGVASFTEKVAADVATTRRLLAGVPDFARPFDDHLLDHDLWMAEVVETERPQVLVHGDLIAKNTLLRRDDTMHVIDPAPCLGPVEFDIAHLCARLSAGEHIEEHLALARTEAARPDGDLPALDLNPVLLDWLAAHTARVYYAYKVAMRQDASGAYLRLVNSPTL